MGMGSVSQPKCSTLLKTEKRNLKKNSQGPILIATTQITAFSTAKSTVQNAYVLHQIDHTPFHLHSQPFRLDACKGTLTHTHFGGKDHTGEAIHVGELVFQQVQDVCPQPRPSACSMAGDWGFCI